MNRLSLNEIRQLLKKLDIESYLKTQKIEYREAGDSTNPQFIVHTCPFCNNINYKGNEHPNRVYIGKENAKFHCYNCGEEGLFLKFAAKFERLSFRNLFDKYLGEGVFEALPDVLKEHLEDNDEKQKSLLPIKLMEMPEEFLPIYSKAHPKYRDAYKYMSQRGMHGNKNRIYRNLDIRYCEYFEYQPSPDKIHVIQKRIIFPVYWEGKMVGFVGRDITGESNIKYYISEGLPKRRIIYNYENIKNAETIIIVEGNMDLIKSFEYNPISLFGTSLSNEQLKLLQALPNLKNIIIGLDPDTKLPDKNGNIKFNKLVEQLKPFWNILDIDLRDKEDLGACSFDEVSQIIKEAVPYKEKGLTLELK